MARSVDSRILNIDKIIGNILVITRTKIKYSGVRVIASRILHDICLLIGELANRGTNLTLIGEHYCIYNTKVVV